MKHPFSVIKKAGSLPRKRELSDAETLAELPVGRCGKVLAVGGAESMRQRLWDIGFQEGTIITCVGKSPMGDPAAFLVKGCVMALRRQDSGRIRIGEVADHGEN